MPGPLRGGFPTTRRSVVEVLRSTDEGERRVAYESLVEAYWRAAYKHLRLRWRLAEHDAQDRTQAFFAAALEKDFLAGYDAGKARFRTFLRVCLDRFAAKELEASRRLKRGGGTRALSLDFEGAEGEIARAGAAQEPEGVFDREWMRDLMGRAVDALRTDCDRRGRPARFALFSRCYLDPPVERETHAQLAERFGLKPSDVNNELASARRELRRIVLDRLRCITASDEEFRSEARLLLGESPP